MVAAASHELGDVLIGSSQWTRSDAEITLFDSTGVAIQDLAICQAIYERWREGGLRGPGGQP